MDFKYFNIKDKNNLINKLFKLSFSSSDLPFETIIIPIGYPTIAYLYNDEQISIYDNTKRTLKGLMITGQHYGAYDYCVNDEGLTYGFELHPTAIYKIFKYDQSKLKNQHLKGSMLNQEFSEKLQEIFIECKNDEKLYVKKVISFFNNLELIIDEDVKQIDKAIDFIFEKKGMLQINDLLKKVSFSQKSLETKFKKIIGLTPGKYIKLIRFSALMRKYKGNEINLNDLIYSYDYYDQSHFIKDFKLFLNQTPKSYFKEDYPLLEKYLID